MRKEEAMNRVHTIRALATGLCLLAGTADANTIVPAPPQGEPVVLRNATIHTVSGETIENGQILVAGGRIGAIAGPGDAPLAADRVIDLEGLDVYPGLISANTMLGLVEIEAVRATVDVAEPGAINPNARAEVAVNPDSENLPVARANGILVALTAPTGGLLAGRSAAIQLDGWTSEDMTIRAPVGMHLNLPRLRVPDELPEPQRRRFIEQRDEQLELLTTSFEEAQAYRKAKAAGEVVEIDRRWEAMLAVFARELPVLAHVEELMEIRHALRLADEYGFDLVIVGGADAWRIADLLAEREVPVIVAGLHRTPVRRWESYSTPSENPVRLHEAGVKVAIANMGGTFIAPIERNLAYEAAEAVAFGLDPDEAIRMITLYPAEILGIDDRVGSIDVGKDATLIVTDGNPLDIRTNVVRAFVQGREIDLSSRHTALYEKYAERLRQLDANP
jgi:imidazolonepropionase-like amidohydrolase